MLLLGYLSCHFRHCVAFIQGMLGYDRSSYDASRRLEPDRAIVLRFQER